MNGRTGNVDLEELDMISESVYSRVMYDIEREGILNSLYKLEQMIGFDAGGTYIYDDF